MKTENKPDSARVSRGHGSHGIARIWAFVVEGLAVLGTLMIGVLMIIICADIVFRNLLGASLPLVSELGALVLVMIVYLQLATTVRADRLARTEIFLPPFKRRFPKSGRLIAALFDFVGAAMLGLIAWSTLRIFEKDFSSGEFIGVTGIATLPTWPFRAMILLGVTVAAIEFIVRAASNLRTSDTGADPQ
ncbi:TRAP transporter small permease subunit [Sulfitobacter sp. HGT1]|uniref:TRAP transporter small permease subunit n=1 Tax=Sulfitobacter sp. HGT1 TaxID=2735435 RepID=UPI0020CC9C33|nr:TRAP transporter small permease [Sulfitobacter sp. HGT1]